jgi:hypothetical protein
MRFDNGREDLYHCLGGGKKIFIKISRIPETPGSVRINNPFRFTPGNGLEWKIKI